MNISTANLTQLVQLAVSLLVVLVIPTVGYVLTTWLHESKGSVRMQKARATALDLVRSAEQTLETDDHKRAWVETWLSRACPFLTQPEIHMLIESAVLNVHTDLGVSSHVVEVQPNLGHLVEPLVQQLSSLVAPSLQSQISQIVSDHLQAPASPPTTTASTTGSPVPEPAPVTDLPAA